MIAPVSPTVSSRPPSTGPRPGPRRSLRLLAVAGLVLVPLPREAPGQDLAPRPATCVVPTTCPERGDRPDQSSRRPLAPSDARTIRGAVTRILSDGASSRELRSLARQPGAWRVIAPLARERSDSGDLSPEARARLLDLCSLAPPEVGRELGHALWVRHGDDFDLEHLLAFATIGVEPCVRSLRDRVAVDARMLDIRDVRPAAFLAMRGEPLGEHVLERARDLADPRPGSVGRSLLSALALESLGHPLALEQMERRVGGAARQAYREGALEVARDLALEAQAFAAWHSGAGSLAWLDERLREHRASAAGEPWSAEAVQQLIQSVTPM